ncbi:unnamed protein product [Cylicocyclus nassatus]|uniref:ShKT domain-containing protein n=1 Tax=Cylicocyclus nassatus TaxID=53992 RepID=A0AA36DLW5_CYLNA|nr:unnamed protein product [Cylicocyclus nassatus]
MLSISILQVLFFLHLTRQQQFQDCANGGTGPCLSDQTCGSATELCIVTSLGYECCAIDQIITPTVSPASSSPVTVATTESTATTTQPCVDLLNPSTGVSDCAGLAYLCNNNVYWALMTKQCPKTCNRCGTPSCQDLVDVRTGVSNCAQMASFCTNSVYLDLMREQCPKTCGYCV